MALTSPSAASVEAPARSAQDDGDDHAVQTNGFSEDHDQHQSHKDRVGLGVGAHTGIAGDAKSKARGERGKTAAEAGSEVLVTLVHGERGIVCLALEEDGNDEAVNTKDTRHNNRNKGLEDLGGVNHTEGGDTDAGLCNAVGRAQVGEDKSRSNTHEGEEVC